MFPKGETQTLKGLLPEKQPSMCSKRPTSDCSNGEVQGDIAGTTSGNQKVHWNLH
jgi:hypothetical protein